MKKKMLSFLLGISLLVGTTGLPVYAATTSATLNSTNTTVTTVYSDCKSSTIAYLDGYEIHSTTGNVVHYYQARSTTDTGSVTFTHNADTGYKFQLLYNKTQLRSQVYVGGVQVADVLVTY